jgi:hypothetical protein
MSIIILLLILLSNIDLSFLLKSVKHVNDTTDSPNCITFN